MTTDEACAVPRMVTLVLEAWEADGRTIEQRQAAAKLLHYYARKMKLTTSANREQSP